MVGPCVFASHASDFVNGLSSITDGGILAYIGRQPMVSETKVLAGDFIGKLDDFKRRGAPKRIFAEVG